MAERNLDVTAELARRIERCEGHHATAIAYATARLRPESNAGSRAMGGGVAVYAGPGSSLSKAVAVGVGEEVEAEDMALIEEFLGRDGSEVRIEVGPFSDASLLREVAERRFTIVEWNLVLVRTLSDRLRTGQKTDVEVSPVSSGDDERVWAETLTRSFMERDDIGEEEVALALPMTKTSSLHCFLARTKKGTPIGAAAMGIRDGVATLFGAAVLPLHRRIGAHQALIQVRLDAAIAYGCEIATSSTLPGSAAQRNIERWGFRVAYPKVLMLREGAQASPRSKRVSFEDL